MLLAMDLADGIFEGIWEFRDIYRWADQASDGVELKHSAPRSGLNPTIYPSPRRCRYAGIIAECPKTQGS